MPLIKKRVFGLLGRIREHLRSKGSNHLLLLLSFLFCLGMLEVALRFEIIDRLSRSRSYDVNGYEFRYHVTLNSDFFRDEEFHRSKDPATVRIFLIGDSFVFGAGVGQQETIDKILEQRLNENSTTHYEVYNLGHPGDTPFEYYQTAKRFKNYQPDWVILSFYVDNDVWQENWTEHLKITNLWGGISDRWHYFLWKHRWSDCIVPEIDQLKLDPFFKEKFCKAEINPFLAFAQKNPELHQSYVQKRELFEKVPDTKNRILDIQKMFPHTPFLLLLQPSKYQVSNKSFEMLRKVGFPINSDEPVDRRLQDEIISWAQAHQVEVLDVLPFMRKEEGKSFYHTIDDHYNESGNEFVADLLYHKSLMVPGVARQNSP